MGRQINTAWNHIVNTVKWQLVSVGGEWMDVSCKNLLAFLLHLFLGDWQTTQKLILDGQKSFSNDISFARFYKNLFESITIPFAITEFWGLGTFI